MPPRGYNPYFRLVDDYVYIVLNSFGYKMAGSTRLELAASGVTGRRYNQLNYNPAQMVGGTGFEPATLGL